MAFLFILLFLAYNLKADFFALIFLISVYIFVLVYLFIINPSQVGLRVLIDLFSNPINLLYIIVPSILIISIRFLYTQIKKA